MPGAGERQAIPVVAAIVTDKRGRVLLAQRPERDDHAMKWEFPGGKLRRGESPEECLRREIEEELSIRVDVGAWFHSVRHTYPKRSIVLTAYWCTWAGGEIRLNAHRDCRWVEIRRLPEFDLTAPDRRIALRLIRAGGRP